MDVDLVAVLMSQKEQPLSRRMVLTCQNSEARFDSSVVPPSLSLSLSLFSNKVVMTDIL